MRLRKENMTISDEAVEAATSALLKAWGYEAIADSGTSADVRIALEAAAPLIAKQVVANAINYAEDQAMAGAYFPDWRNCADKLKSIPSLYGSAE